MGVHRRVTDLFHALQAETTVVFRPGLKQHFHWMF
jgi:hypothetical protein